MRRLGALAVLSVLILTGCGPQTKSEFRPATPAGGTGYADKQGIDYLHNGDPYVQRRLQEIENEQPPASQTPAVPAPAEPAPSVPAPGAPAPAQPAPGQTPAQPAAPAQQSLKERLKEFEISRFSKDEKHPSRFGDSRFELKIFFRTEKPVAFKGMLEADHANHFNLSGRNGDYALKGELTDADGKTTGVFHISDSKTGETLEVSYRAYKAKLTVRHDSDKAAGEDSALGRQLRTFCDNAVDVVTHCKNTFGWVNNWSVIQGPAFYLVDIVKVLQRGQSADYVPPVVTFKGESKRTSGENDVYEHPVESSNPNAQGTLVGNAETDAGRMFEVTLNDPKTKEQNQVYLDVIPEQPEGEDLKPDETPMEYGLLETEDEGGQDIADPSLLATETDPSLLAKEEPAGGDSQHPALPAQGPVPAPKPQTEQPKAQQPQPQHTGSAFMATDMSQARAARMVRDFNQNRDIPNVRKFIRKFQDGSSDVPNIRNFFIYGNPFRPMLKSIARTYDVTPLFSVLTVVESGYFTQGKYELKPGDGGRAIGAFQMHPPAAAENGLPASHRVYFAPAACAAARYMATFVNKFWKGDTTVAILAYNQGGGGAQKLLDRSIRLGGKYAYRYTEMEKLGALSQAHKNYVNKYLAAYFISSNLTHYGFDPRLPGARTSLPKNSVFPPGGIKDSTCRNAVNISM